MMGTLIHSTSNNTGTGVSTSKLMYLISLFNALTLGLAEAHCCAIYLSAETLKITIEISAEGSMQLPWI